MLILTCAEKWVTPNPHLVLNNLSLTPTEFHDYLSWPGDRHNFSGEAGTYGVGTRVEDTPEMVAEPTGAATNDEHSSSEWWCWHRVEQSHKRRLILLMNND